MTDRRRFNNRERDAFYDDAAGCCAECERPLAPGWHADHVTPRSRGGATEETNGQALCPDCNLKKGNRMTYHDAFKPRPAQADVLDKVRENVAQGKKQTVALLAPGSGKELLGQAAGCELLRMGLTDLLVVLTPRIQLAGQCETNWRAARDPLNKRPRKHVLEDWAGHFELFDPAGRIEFIEHIENRRPLIDPSRRAFGIASTYQSLVTPRGQVAFEEFAKRHQGRFLVVADEAQFCGDDDGGGGTRAGEMVKLLDHYAAHMLIMTGTPERSDGSPLVCCRYGEPNEKGVRPLLYDVRATYQDGIREGYLRKFVASVTDSKVSRRDIETHTETISDLSKDGSNLGQVVRRPEVWRPLVDDVAAAVRDKKRRHPAYQGLISCMERSDAHEVFAYWKRTHPDLRVVIATSDREDAVDVLNAFKAGAADVLVTVRMAFIGYDCKTITVIGVLTHYRDKGHLMQLVGRGLRVSDHESFDDQSCHVIAPDDPAMQKFIEELRQESEQGIRERSTCGGGDGPGPSTVVVDDAEYTGTRAVTPDGEVSHADYAKYVPAARQFGIVGDPQDLVEFGRYLERLQQQRAQGTSTQEPPAATNGTAPKKTKERIEDLLSETSKLIKAAVVHECGVKPDEPGYDDAMIQLTGEVNRKAGGNSAWARRDEGRAQRRYDVADRLFGTERSAAP